MSADIAVLVPAGGRRARADRETRSESGRIAVRLAAFAALGLYGTLRWATMLTPAPVWRLLGLWALSVAVAWIGGLLAPRSRVAVAALAVVAIVVAFPLAGVPLTWVRHVRIAVTADGISEGLSALPRALVPYTGVNEWLRTVIALGAAVLLLDGALMLAFAPRGASDIRRAAAVLPLVALAVVPSTLNRPPLAYAHGLVLFVLIAACMWGERLRSGEAVIAGSLAALAGAAAMIAAPALDIHKPWLNYQALAGNLAPAHPETFDWTQRYGPLHWPRSGHDVFDVQAPRADYWKTENLDVFDGKAWVSASLQVPNPSYAIDAPSARRQWSERLHVTLRGMRTNEVIAAGTAQAPNHVPSVTAGDSDGTWSVPTGLAPGDSYTIDVYAPHPSTTELTDAGTDYPNVLLPAYTSVFVPPNVGPVGISGSPAAGQVSAVYFPAFGSRATGVYGANSIENYKQLIHDSRYARAYALSQRLVRGATTPYSYVLAVKNYLSRGFTYNENPPASAYPLETFLFKSKRGYCQQFAGAMALLLRMGGIPARVATGFTSGSYDSATKSWVVQDIDAHAWVEAWFPHYGWVRFDPTPAAAPARGGRTSLLPAKLLGSNIGRGNTSLGGRRTVTSTGAPAQRQHSGGGFPVVLVVILVVVLALLAGIAVAVVRFGEPTEDELLAELERALERCGRPLRSETTLAGLEHRFRDAPGAQEYVRALRLARFAGAGELPPPRLRRAVRRALRDGLGSRGLPRSVWALPPRLRLRRTPEEAPPQGLESATE
jgi:transglutaminase-like putative cysteine protease